VCHEAVEIELPVGNEPGDPPHIRAGGVRAPGDAQVAGHDVEVAHLDQARIPGHEHGPPRAVEDGQALRRDRRPDRGEVHDAVDRARETAFHEIAAVEILHPAANETPSASLSRLAAGTRTNSAMPPL